MDKPTHKHSQYIHNTVLYCIIFVEMASLTLNIMMQYNVVPLYTCMHIHTCIPHVKSIYKYNYGQTCRAYALQPVRSITGSNYIRLITIVVPDMLTSSAHGHSLDPNLVCTHTHTHTHTCMLSRQSQSTGYQQHCPESREVIQKGGNCPNY